MAKKETKFRQEFNVTTDGILGKDLTNQGIMNVEEILSLHIDVVNRTASLIVEARIGQGDWRQIANVPNAENLNYVDLREYEFIRIRALNIVEPTKVIIFGYDSPIKQTSIQVELTENETNRNIENNILLQDILKELKKVSTQLSFITDEEI